MSEVVSKKCKMNAIFGLLVVVIGIYIGVNLLPGMNTTVRTITTPTYGAGVAGLLPVALIVFAAMIVVFVVNGARDSA